MKLLKKLLVIAFFILVFILMCLEPKDPYYSQQCIPQKVYAKGKPKRVKKKTWKQEYENLGEFALTAYCGCSYCSGGWGSRTSTGTKAKAKHTIAVDPKVIKYGTKVYINGESYTAEDCGGGIKGKHIDIYFDSHSEAIKFGRQKTNVYVKNKPRLISKLRRCKNVSIKRIASQS